MAYNSSPRCSNSVKCTEEAILVSRKWYCWICITSRTCLCCLTSRSYLQRYPLSCLGEELTNEKHGWNNGNCPPDRTVVVLMSVVRAGNDGICGISKAERHGYALLFNDDLATFAVT